MKGNRVNKFSYINLILGVIVILGGCIQFFYDGGFISVRRLRPIIGYFFILPSLIVSIYTIFEVIRYYYCNKYGVKFLYIYRSIPIILIWIYIFFVFLFNILFVI